MRILFIGASKFGLRCLETLLQMPDMDVVGIVTNPETFSISYRPAGVRNVLHVDFGPMARKYNLPFWVMTRKMKDPELVEQIREWNPDFILVVGWYHIVPKVIRDIAPTGGLHASLLPDYSGGAPLVWAIINDEKKTGITFFLFDKGVDSGPIIGQQETLIYFEDTIATLYVRIEEAGIQLLQEHLPKIANGTATYLPQDESKRRIMPQRTPEDGQINWNWPARRIYNFIRAQTRPYPGAFTFDKQQKLTIWKAGLSDTIIRQAEPGEIIELEDIHNNFWVVCGDKQLLSIQEVGLPDGTIISGTAYLDQRQITLKPMRLGFS